MLKEKPEVDLAPVPEQYEVLDADALAERLGFQAGYGARLPEPPKFPPHTQAKPPTKDRPIMVRRLRPNVGTTKPEETRQTTILKPFSSKNTKPTLSPLKKFV